MIRRVEVPGAVFEVSDESGGANRAREAGGAPQAERECVVLLHGFTGSKQSWACLRSALAQRRRVVSLDLPGHGATVTSGAAGCPTMAQCAELVAEVLAALGVERFSLVGYSMGGRLALFLALRQARRIHRLVLESASAGIAEPAERARRRAADEELAALVEKCGVEAFIERWERIALFESLAELALETRAELRRQRLSCQAGGLAASLRGMGAGAQPWLGEQLGRLAMPALIIAGGRDSKFVAIGRELAARLPKARLAIIAGAGHVAHLERPAMFNRTVIDFLDGRP